MRHEGEHDLAAHDIEHAQRGDEEHSLELAISTISGT